METGVERIQRRKFLCISAFLIVLFLVIIPFAVFAADFYVLPYDADAFNGNGISSMRVVKIGADGAWNGLENINWDKIHAGDRVLLQCGAEYYGQIKIVKSGEPGKYVIFSIFGNGANPAISGGKQLSQRQIDWHLESQQQRWVCAEFADGSWSNGIYNAAVVDGKPLKRSYSSDFRFFYGEFSNACFNISVFPDSEPWKHKIYVATLQYNVLVNGKNYIKFNHIDFTLANGWSQPQFGSVHIINNSKHVEFAHCSISNGAFSGFWVDSSDYITINNCEIYGNYCTGFYFRAGSSYATISGCKIYRNGKYLSVNNATDTGGLLMGSSGIGKGHLIENNEIYNNANQTVADRVDGKAPNGNYFWSKYNGNIWKKNLSSLKRWAGAATNQGVWFLGINNKPVEQAEGKNLCSPKKRWFWDRRTETLFFYSEVDPNNFSGEIEIAWKNGPDPAISLWGITDTIVKNNFVHDNFSSGIGVAYTTSANVAIENNRVENGMEIKHF